MTRNAPEKGISDEAYRMVKRKAYSFHITMGVPIDELEDEALVCYVSCLKSYDPSNSSGAEFETYFYAALNNWLRTFCGRWYKQLPAFHWEGEDFPDVPSHDAEPLSWKVELSDDAKAVLTVLIKYETEIIGNWLGKDVRNPNAPRHVKTALIKALKDMGWIPFRIHKTFRELKEAAASL